MTTRMWLIVINTFGLIFALHHEPRVGYAGIEHLITVDVVVYFWGPRTSMD